MSYPSLLFYDIQEMKKIPQSVFEDLQLLCFISKETTNSIRYSCSLENRNARRSFFDAVINNNVLDKLIELNKLCQNIIDLNDSYVASSNDEEKKLIFVSIMKADKEFSNCASKFNLGDSFSSRFSTYFTNRLNETLYASMTEDLPSSLEAFSSITSFSLTSDLNNVYLSDKTGDSFYDTLINCSKELGLNTAIDFKRIQDRVSPDTIKAIVSEKKEKFDIIAKFYNKYKTLYSDTIKFYKTETDFYISILKLIESAKKIGVPFCNPVEENGRTFDVYNAFDISLIAKNEENIIPNDIHFTDEEPFYYLTGANGGGKTTYLRAVGIITVLYLLGCPLPCEKAHIGGINSVYTHFPRDERFDGSGRFVEEKGRVDTILSKADKSSVVLFNETYSSTNEENAVKMTTELANTVHSNGIYGLYITHQHAIGETVIPFLKVVIDTDNMNKRTFKISKCRSTGGSFATDILKKYHLTAEDLEKRLGKIAEDM